MQKNKWSVIQIASVYTGTVLCAGFASGQEMMRFFAYYGWNGIYGIFLTGILLSILGWAILEMVYTYRIKDYREFIYPMMGEFLGNIIEWSVLIFMFISFCAMLAGTGAVLHQRFQLPVQVGIIAMAILCVITFLYDVKGVIAVNSILAPLLLVGGILLGIYLLVCRDEAAFSSVVEVFYAITRNWVSSSIIYVSYNTLTSVVVLCSLLPLLHSKKSARWGGILGGAALGILGFFMAMATLIHYGKIQGLEIPMLAIVLQYSPLIQNIYLFVLMAAMFTTAVANGYGFISRISVIAKVSQKTCIVIFTLFSMVIAQVGFSNMVAKVYPIFGYIGIFEVVMILLYFIHYKCGGIKRRIGRSLKK
jgi:uncharacterized membrane protein YkvI